MGWAPETSKMQPVGMGADTCYDPDFISVRWQLDQQVGENNI